LTWVHLSFTSFAGIGWLTNAKKVVDMVNACAVIFAGPQQAIVDVDLAVFALETRFALTTIRVEMRLTAATMLAWIGLAQVDFLLAPFAFVAIFALAHKLTEAVLAGTTVETRVGCAFVDIRLASGSIESTCALAFVSCYDVDTITSIFTWLAHTLVDLGLAISSCITRFTLALIAVDSINAFSVDARVVNAVIVVLFTVLAPSAGQALTFVTIRNRPVNAASAAIMARISTACVDGAITEETSVTRMTIALEGVGATDAITMDTRVVVELTLVFVDLAAMARETWTAIAGKSRVVGISARSTIHARVIVAAILGHPLATFASKANGTCAAEAVDEIRAYATILAWVRVAFIDV